MTTPQRALAVQLVEPSGSVSGSNLEFRWRAESNATEYLWRLVDQSGRTLDASRRSAGAFDCAGGGTCSYRPGGLSAGQYAWEVRPFIGSNRGAWSGRRSFTVGSGNGGSGGGDSGGQNGGGNNGGGNNSGGNSGGASGNLLAPSGTIEGPNAELRWRPYGNATTYLVRVKNSSGNPVDAEKRSAGSFSCGSGTCSYTTPNLSDGDYGWQVRPFEGSNRGDWSATLPFAVAASSGGSNGGNDNGNGGDNNGGNGGGDDGNNGGGSGSDDPGSDGPVAYPSIFKPPQPLANLRIEQLKPRGIQSFNGPGNQDLLLVAPNQEVDDVFEVRVNGFRGIYLIGGSFNVKPQGWLTTPNGKRVDGMAKIFQFKTHANPVSRPFIYMSKLKFRSDQVNFGDIFQIGGAAGTGAMRNWTDFYAWKIKADSPVGWRRYYGGSFSKNVSHSDFVIKTGGVRNVYVGKADVTAGYQHYFTVPGWTTGRTAYRGPEGIAETHYWSTVSRIKVNSSIGSISEPTVFFMAIGSGEVAQGQYATHYFHEGSSGGAGNYIVPLPGKGSILTHVHPENGNYAPRDRGTFLEWPQTSFPGGNPFVVGRVHHGGKKSPPTMVRDGEVGFQHRVTSRQELINEINGGYRN